MLLDKVEKEKDENRGLNFQLQCLISDLWASLGLLMETCITCSSKTEIAKNHMQNLILLPG